MTDLLLQLSIRSMLRPIPEWVHDRWEQEDIKNPNSSRYWDKDNPPRGWIWNEITYGSGPKEGQGMGIWGWSRNFNEECEFHEKDMKKLNEIVRNHCSRKEVFKTG